MQIILQRKQNNKRSKLQNKILFMQLKKLRFPFPLKSIYSQISEMLDNKRLNDKNCDVSRPLDNGTFNKETK